MIANRETGIRESWKKAGNTRPETPEKREYFRDTNYRSLFVPSSTEITIITLDYVRWFSRRKLHCFFSRKCEVRTWWTLVLRFLYLTFICWKLKSYFFCLLLTSILGENGGRRSWYSIRMAKYGTRRRKRHATDRFGAVVYAAVDVGQYRPVFRKVSGLINDIQSTCYLISKCF